MNFDLDNIESYVANHLRLFISMAAGILVFVGIIAVLVFFINVRGAEQTMVPDVQGKDLTAALLELQVKELYPRINLRFSQTSTDKGLVLEQNPLPGTIVKAGRRIQLVVSQGVMINTIESYLGRNVDEVRMDLQTLVPDQEGSGDTPAPQLITLKDPLMYEYSSEPAGTVLQQRPEPGTSISGPTVLELVVSRGPENAMTKLPNLVGLDLNSTLEQIGQTGIDFVFTIRPVREGEKPGTVVAQDPAGDTMASSDTRVSITMVPPDNLSDKEVFGLFKYDMAKNPYPLLVRLDCILPSGEQQRLLSVQYPGGPLAVPYRQPSGSVLVLSMLNREIYRQAVSK
ncbi:MAG: PASTA domain-containing protein [Treponema sp.]|nr:PASTA domain-containing protein [Treponema sp.]